MDSRLAAATSLVCGLAAACDSPQQIYLELAAPPGGLLLFAIGSANGSVEYAGALTADARAETAAPRDGMVITWALDPRTILLPSGEVFPEASLKDLVFHSTSEPDIGGCGRCLAPSDGDAWLMHPGSRCSVPLGLEASVMRVEAGTLVPGDPADAAIIAAQVRLSWPGACPCGSELPERAASSDLLLCPITPEEGPWSFTGLGLALAPDGSVGMFSKHRAAIIDANGTLHETRDFPPFIDIPRASLALPASAPEQPLSFLVMDRVVTQDARPPIVFRLDASGLTASPWPSFQPGIRVVGARWTSSARDRLTMFGAVESGNSSSPAVSEVEGDFVIGNPVRGTVQAIEGCEGRLQEERLVDAIVTVSGVGVGVMSNGLFAFQPSAGAPWTCAPDFAIESTGAPWTVPAPPMRLESLGTKVYLCATSNEEEPTSFGLLSFDTELIRTSSNTDDIIVEAIADLPAGGCQWIAPIPAGDRLLASFGDGRVLELDGVTPTMHASLAAARGAPDIATDLTLTHYLSTANGHELIANVGTTSIWARQPGPSFTQIHGPADAPPVGPYVVSSAPAGRADGAAVIFRGSGASPIVVDDVGSGSSCDRFSTELLSDSGPVPTGRRATAAVHPEEGGYLLFTGSSTSAGKVSWLDENALRVEREDELPPELGPVVAATELNQGAIIAFGETGAIITIHDPNQIDQAWIELVMPIWDDPRTETVEVRPESFSWRGMDVSEGVGWAHGKNILARVLPDPEGSVRVEGYWLSRARLGPFSDPDVIRRMDGRLPVVSSLQTTCPDAALFITDETERDASPDLETKRLYSWRIGPESSCAAPSAQLVDGSLEICDIPFFSKFRFTDDASDGGMALFPTSKGLLNVVGEGSIFGDEMRYPLPNRVRWTRYEPSSRLLLYSEGYPSAETERVGIVVEAD